MRRLRIVERIEACIALIIIIGHVGCGMNDIVTSPGKHRIRAEAITHHVVACIAQQGICAAATGDNVVSPAADQRVVAATADNFIGPRAGLDHLEIGNAVAADLVTACVCGNKVDDDRHEGC